MLTRAGAPVGFYAEDTSFPGGQLGLWVLDVALSFVAHPTASFSRLVSHMRTS